MTPKTALVMTTIYPPSSPLVAFLRSGKFAHVVVVGDKKTPSDWSVEGTVYLAPEEHSLVGPELGNVLPWNHYSRKMIGYLWAIKRGADHIFDTDDDNAPETYFYPWPLARAEGFETLDGGQGFINIYRAFSSRHIWPRGLPLDEIYEPSVLKFCEKSSFENVAVFQACANGSPDVDALYRITGGCEEVEFSRRDPIVAQAGTISPLNSQSTTFRAAVYPLLYLPATVSFRFTDILRGVVAQPILWKFGFRAAFGEATVRQQRNPHNLVKDFWDEIPVYATVARP